jgi:hypothetical protein
LGSDIVDLLSLLNETEVQESTTMSYFTLAIFSWSLFQFCLNLIVTRGRSFQSVAMDDEDEVMDDVSIDPEADPNRSFTEELKAFTKSNKKNGKNKKILCISTKSFSFDVLDTEIWSILITLLFQVIIHLYEYFAVVYSYILFFRTVLF